MSRRHHREQICFEPRFARDVDEHGPTSRWWHERPGPWGPEAGAEIPSAPGFLRGVQPCRVETLGNADEGAMLRREGLYSALLTE